MLESKINEKSGCKKGEGNQENDGNKQIKEDVTKYSKAVPAFLMEQLKDRSEQTLLQQEKLREYAS